MTIVALHRQLGRRGPVLCHYRIPLADGTGYKLSRSSHAVLLTFGARGHAFGIGWTVD